MEKCLRARRFIEILKSDPDLQKTGSMPTKFHYEGVSKLSIICEGRHPQIVNI